MFSPNVTACYQCATCGEIIETVVDPSQGERQRYIEDCEVCCRPNLLTVLIDEEGPSATIEATFEE